MIKFYVLSCDNKRECTAVDPAKAAQILSLMFHNSKGYVVNDNKVVFAQNMTVEEAEVIAGLTKPVVVAPKATVAKASKPKVAAKATVAKKVKIKSKVVKVKNKPGKAKKTVLKAKPKAKPKVKAKANKTKTKKKGKKR